MVRIIFNTDFEDTISETIWNESILESSGFENFKAKAEHYIREHEDNEVIAKLKSNVPLSADDVKERSGARSTQNGIMIQRSVHH